MKKYHIIVFIIVSFLISLYAYQYFFKSWDSYYHDKLYKDPRPLLIKALLLQKKSTSKKALDLGAGVGNDTAYLLKQGWNVWANDIESLALRILDKRVDIQEFRNKLVLIPGSFSTLAWEDLPQFDLIYAGYSLFFANFQEFIKVWDNMQQSLVTGGLFVGHFLAPDHAGFNWWEKRNMTLLTKDQVLNLLHNFTIEWFEESDEINERGIRDHGFDVIVRKK